MIVLGIILLIVGYWLLPQFLPETPPPLDHVSIFLGWLFLVVGIVLLILGVFAGRSIGGRRYWY